MINKDGTPHTAQYGKYGAYGCCRDNQVKSIKEGILADVATTILDLMQN